MRLKPRAGSSPAFGTNQNKPSCGGFYFIYGDLKIVNYKKILYIIFTSSFLGLVINYVNPNGIPLLREKQEIKWAPDSLFLNSESDALSNPKDTTNLSPVSKTAAENQVEKKDEITTQDTPTKDQKKIISKNNVAAFSEPQAIKLEQAFALYNKNVLFIDARDESDYLVGHVTGSINIPFEDLDNYKQELEQIPKDKPVVVYCAGTECDLSVLLGDILYEKGFKQVYVFFGGWVEWQDAKYPIAHPSGHKNE